jgi:3-oxoacyl-[acyl-carrier-protein] synthase III
MSQIRLHADAALSAMADAGLRPADIDRIATAGETPVTIAHYLGLTPKLVDGTAVVGCVGRTRNAVAPTSLAGQF